MSLRVATTRVPAAFLLIAGTYVFLRAAAFGGVGVRPFPDTASYIDVSSRSLLSLDFWASERSWMTPLLYKLPGDSLRAWAQFIISLVSWLALATTVARATTNRRVRLIAFTAVLLFSMSIWIIQWDPVLLSESLSVSLTAAVLALWLALIERPRWSVIAGLVVVSLLWVNTRDTNAYLLLVALPGVLVWAWRGRERAMAGMLALALVALFGLSLATASTDRAPRYRWMTPMLNVIGMRILPDAERTQWFVDRGLPVTPRLQEESGWLLGVENSDGGQPRVWVEPPLFPVLDWVQTKGRGVYARYLLTHPYYAISPLFSKRDPLLSVEPAVILHQNYPLSYYRPEQARAAIPGWIDEIVFPPDVQALTFWLVLAVVAAALVLRAARGRPALAWLVPLALLVSTPPHLLLVWHGDAGEVTRHAIVAIVALRIALLLTVLFTLDAWVTQRSRVKASAVPATV